MVRRRRLGALLRSDPGYGLAGTPIEVHQWLMQANADRVLGADLVVLSVARLGWLQ
jgi:hypothetical protein